MDTEIKLDAMDLSTVALVALADQMAAHQAELDGLRKQYVARLPEASDEQMVLVLAAAKNETELPAGCKPGVDFRLSEAQQKVVKATREARVAWLATRKAELVNPLVACNLTALTSFKVRVGAKATTSTARFVKRVAAAPKTGLIAALRASLVEKGWKG